MSAATTSQAAARPFESSAEMRARFRREAIAAGEAIKRHEERFARGEVLPTVSTPVPGMFEHVWCVPMSDGMTIQFKCDGDDDRAFLNAQAFIREALANVRSEEAA